MKNSQIAVIGVDAKMDSRVFEEVCLMELLDHTQLHFVHLVEMKDYGDGVAFNVSFLSKMNQEEHGPLVIEKMKQMASKFASPSQLETMTFSCLFSETPETELNKYLRKVAADFLILSGHSHWFSRASFLEEMRKVSTCHLIVLPAQGEPVRRYTKALVGIDFEQDVESIKNLLSVEFISNLDLCLIHVSSYKEIDAISDSPNPFSLDEALIVVEERAQRKLSALRESLLENKFDGEIKLEVLISHFPRKTFTKYLHEHSFHLGVLFEKNKRPVFNQFIPYMEAHSKVPLLIVKELEDLTLRNNAGAAPIKTL